MKKIVLTLLMCALVLSFTSSCSCSSGFKYGQKVMIKERCIGAIDASSYKEMDRLCARRDEAGLNRLDYQGKIDILSWGSEGEIVGMAFGRVKIRLNKNGREYWVATKFVK